VRRATAVVAALGMLVLAGCGAQGAAPAAAPGADPGGDAGGVSVTGRAASAQSPSASEPPVDPSLPPGDPGLDAPAVPDPGTAGPDHDEHEHGEDARRSVPAAALLTAPTVRMVLGGRWDGRAGGGDECLRPGGAVATRSMTYGGSVEASLLETVATYPDAEAADRAVARLGEAAAGCGWTAGADPRVGSVSVSATAGHRTMTAVSSEGVLVLLVGAGDVTRKQARWGSLVDMALGTSCAAAAHGCH
jgi:hypothetical protein